ncbi:BTAD domain-containing putative transcriptional regulator, partial [Streptomyces sp. NPDC087901]|uniref:BTAD domain-containing putative transcriptional regulator n=1 Tax=Streptomyces sp. NPDC087901 TaxID=3365818 RepID=UPI0037F427DA
MLRSAVDRSPSDEPLHLLLARTLLDPGRPLQAIQQFHACRRALTAELGTRPGPDVQQVHLGPVRRIFAGPRRLARTLAVRPNHPSTSSTRV